VVIDEIDGLHDKKLQKKIVRNLEFLEREVNVAHCLKSKYFKDIKSSSPQLYEIITWGTRIMFCVKNGTCWLLTFFMKSSNKTPMPEIRKAEERAKDIMLFYN
jgi:phage-related protein